jgi:protein involved in polysaccharide export with SLBB domain
MAFVNMSLLRSLLAGLSIIGMTTGFARNIEKGSWVEITARGIPEDQKAILGGLYPVSKDGWVKLPFVGRIPAAGLSSDELAKTLDTVFRGKGIYREAVFQVRSGEDVTVCGPGPDEQVVFVGGQVKKPGPVRMARGGLTIYQAIQEAGGIDFSGQLKRIRLFRDGEERSYDLTDENLRKTPLQKNDAIQVLPKRDNDPE